MHTNGFFYIDFFGSFFIYTGPYLSQNELSHPYRIIFVAFDTHCFKRPKTGYAPFIWSILKYPLYMEHS